MQKDTGSDKNSNQEAHQSRRELLFSPKMRLLPKMRRLVPLDRLRTKMAELFSEILLI